MQNNHFIKAVRFIYENVDQPIKLEDIAQASSTSLSSLKRMFNEITGKAPGEFLRRVRMELAFCSLRSRNNSVLEVALSAGFNDQSAFARCFKETFGYPPTEARKKINIVQEFESMSLDEPDIVELADLTIQCITQQGIYFESAPRAWQMLKEKLAADADAEDFSGVFVGIGHDNPHEGKVAPDKVRYSAGVALVEKNLQLERITLAGGRYARFHYFGRPTNLGMAYHYIYGKWSEESNRQIDPKNPSFIAYDRFPEPFRDEKILIHVPLA